MRPLTSQQRAILTFVDGAGDAPLREINNHLGVVGRQQAHLQRLVATGHLSRTPREEVASYSVTDKGRRALQAGPSSLGGVATPRTLAAHADPYRPKPWRPDHARPGCLDHVRVPSLMGQRRVYRRDAREACE